MEEKSFWKHMIDQRLPIEPKTTKLRWDSYCLCLKPFIFFSVHRGSTVSANKALELVRAALQPSLNSEIETVLKSYQEVFDIMLWLETLKLALSGHLTFSKGAYSQHLLVEN